MSGNHPKRYRLINIVGIDGAGKTTLATGLAAYLSQSEDPVRYVYGQYFAKLLYPVKRFAKKSVMRNTDEFRNYHQYNETKQSFSKRFPVLARLYGMIWLTDYFLQMLFKVTVPILMGKRLIMDRYILDIAVNLSLTMGKDAAMAEAVIRRFCRFAPFPDLVVFIDLPEHIAFERKKDIQSVAYLTERRERYLYLARTFGFKVIDGTLTPSEIFGKALALIHPKSNVAELTSSLGEVHHETP